MKYLHTPITEDDIKALEVGDMISISGDIYTGRDAVLPRLIDAFHKGTLDISTVKLQGSVIFHTAVSIAGIGPTSSNKVEIENSIVPLSQLGVKIHLGKGAISPQTIAALAQQNSIFAILPPVTALLKSQTLSQKIIAFPEEGMEAFHKLRVNGFTAVVAAAKGKSIY